MDFENLAAKKKVFESNRREAEKLRGIVAEGGDFEREAGGRESYQDLLDEAEIHDAENKRIVDGDHEEALAMNAEFDAGQERFAQEAVEKVVADQAAAEKLAEDIKNGTASEAEKR